MPRWLGKGNVMGKRTLNKGDETPSSATNLAQRARNALGSAGNGGTSSAGDARQALLCLASGILCSLGGLAGGGALEAAASQAQGRRAEDGASERHGHCAGLEDARSTVVAPVERRRGGAGGLSSAIDGEGREEGGLAAELVG